jgi:transcriptional regulator with XRE-family HTH domain
VYHIEFARRNLGWSLTQLSTHAQIAASYLSFLENGRAIPSAEQLERLSQALGVPADVLMKEVISFDLRETARESASV